MATDEVRPREEEEEVEQREEGNAIKARDESGEDEAKKREKKLSGRGAGFFFSPPFCLFFPPQRIQDVLVYN